MIMKKEEMKITELYDLTHTLASDYLKQFTYPWEALAGLSDFIIELGNSLDPAEYEKRGENIWVHKTTEGYEGFYHLVSVQGNVTTTKMKYFIRDFDRRSFDARAQKLRDIAEEMNKKYGEGKVEVEIVESYYNMREKIEPCMQLIDYAKAAIEHAGITPIVSPVRGGTDGARLSFKGLPCPNLGTGGHAFHGVFEHITVEGMDKAVLIVKDIIRQFAE